MTDDADKKILARAHEIKAERGISLAMAVSAADDEAEAQRYVNDTIEVVLRVKPRVASWIAREFAPLGHATTEDRLAAYLVGVLNRARVSALRHAEEGQDIQQGGAVTLSRAQFQRKVPG